MTAYLLEWAALAHKHSLVSLSIVWPARWLWGGMSETSDARPPLMCDGAPGLGPPDRGAISVPSTASLHQVGSASAATFPPANHSRDSRRPGRAGGLKQPKKGNTTGRTALLYLTRDMLDWSQLVEAIGTNFRDHVNLFRGLHSPVVSEQRPFCLVVSTKRCGSIAIDMGSGGGLLPRPNCSPNHTPSSDP
jgi:hypothetical protein